MSDTQSAEGLDSYDPLIRHKVLQHIVKNEQLPSVLCDNVNMHLHSFFSYNAQGYSPMHLAIMARQNGWYAAGLCDFDGLDGCEEFLSAGEALGLRASANLETRAFMSAFADKEIDSPGEPGVSYCMGAGFTTIPKKTSKQCEYLGMLQDTSAQRNKALLGRINAMLPEIAIDYVRDVIPLTPSGNATERHIISTYINRSFAVFSQEIDQVRFWASLLGSTPEATLILLGQRGRLEDAVRNRLAKRGGIGYEAPTAKTFPLVEDFFAWVKSCGAIPMESWLDGTSTGEADPRTLLEHSQSLGAMALNIIPDRNWNIPDTAVKAQKVTKLRAILDCAKKLDMPINAGTEMNKAGQVPIDDLDCEVLSEFKTQIHQGAHVMIGHTTLGRFCDFPYSGAEAINEYPTAQSRNEFFASVGALPPISADLGDKLRTVGPTRALEIAIASSKAGAWKQGS